MKTIPALAIGLILVAGGVAVAAGQAGKAGAAGPSSNPQTVEKLRAAIAGPQRTEAERARDKYRHPLETLSFFGLRDDMTVIELFPSQGWFTAILGPVLAEHGKLIVTANEPGPNPNTEGMRNQKALTKRFGEHPEAFGKVESKLQHRGGPFDFGPEGSADMILTFRNLHNFNGEPAKALLAAIHKTLKHGGVLGLTDHRAKPGADPQVAAKSGYLPEAYVIRMVETAGFKLAGKSEINANPKDTKDYAKGVWTLPPTLTLGDVDRDKYVAIGESDRMTLKFIKQ